MGGHRRSIPTAPIEELCVPCARHRLKHNYNIRFLSLTTKSLYRRCVVNERKKYEESFEKYPDLVTLGQFREMLGGIGDSTARKLMQENRVQHFIIRHTYLIPKTYVIDYVLSDDYIKYKKQLRVQV